MPTSRRDFIKYGVAGAVGFGVASAIELPIMNNSVQQKDDQINKLQTALNAASMEQGFMTLNPHERTLVEAIAETMIPTDSNGPGAKEAGVVYFIDRMLAGNYGKGGNMYQQGPFFTPQSTVVTAQGLVDPTNPNSQKIAITYPAGTIKPRLEAGTSYQYAFNPREFWRRGLVFLENYCTAAKGGAFETLPSDTQTTVLQELSDNSSTAVQSAFQGPNAAEFFNEVYDMVVAGFLTDPVYGGNRNLVGWQLIAFNGNYWGDDIGLGSKKLMTAATPVRLPPKSLSQLQTEGGGV